MATNYIETFVATHDDGSQTMVEVFPDKTVQIAQRSDQWSTWGPPIKCKDMTWRDGA